MAPGKSTASEWPVAPCQPPHLTRLDMQVANLSFENYEKLWKMFVDSFAAALLACDGRWDPSAPTAGRLKQLCIEAGALRVAVALAHPSRMTHYHFMMGQARLGPIKHSVSELSACKQCAPMAGRAPAPTAAKFCVICLNRWTWQPVKRL